MTNNNNWAGLSQSEKAQLISIYTKYGYNKLSDITNHYNKFQDGGEIKNEGGYSENTLDKRKFALRLWDPALGFDPVSALSSILFKNQARGEENEYYKAYLGLDNNINHTNVRLKGLDADDNRESEGEYYGTTDRMDKNIQVYADTARVKYMIDNYDLYKKELNLSKSQLERIYKQGVNMMEHPNKFVQMDADRAPGIEYNEYLESTNESNPLGMLGKFGARWNPDTKTIEVHDAYDFPWWVTTFSNIPKRPKTMRIRGRINYDPNKGSVLLRDRIKLDK